MIQFFIIHQFANNLNHVYNGMKYVYNGMKYVKIYYVYMTYIMIYMNKTKHLQIIHSDCLQVTSVTSHATDISIHYIS